MSVQNLEAIVKRLETVTARLEAVSTTTKPALAPKPGHAVTGGAAPAASGSVPLSVQQYDDAVQDAIKEFITLTEKIGGDIGSIVPKIKSIFEEHRNIIWWAAGIPEPPADQIAAKLGPSCQILQDIGAFKDSKRNTPQFNHLSSVVEGLPAVSWVSVKPTPAPFIKESIDASMFYVNRVRKDHKEHEAWVKAWLEIFTNLQKYVRQVHTTGLVFNSAPGSVPPAGAKAASPAPAAAPAPKGPGGPPPPPPPPPADIFADVKKNASNSDADKAARAKLFAELNKGEAVTAGLKKVTADMQTHKNPNLRAASTVPAAASSPAAGGPSKTAPKPAVVKPPRTELENYKNWAVEYHKGNKNIVVEIADIKQTVYIFRCEDSVIQIKGKVNSITLDGCKKVGVTFDALLGQVEVINSQSVQVQTLSSLPTISIQKTDGCQVYLSKDSLDAEIVTSKSSEMNILLPIGEDGDFVEFPVPEQFKTTFNKATKKLATTVSDIV
uniref:Adenylyl cyclase-associated protein n=1 Tax=Panagrellus redivivus TaxID=6233 RepID=A0A7E4ZX44_PANRE